MSLSKRILKSDTVRNIACWLTAKYIRFVVATSTWETIRGEIPEAYWKEGKPFILAFWHGRILMTPRCWTGGKTINMLISQHRDGQLIARTVTHFGVTTIAGSTSKGGAIALRAMLKILKSNGYVGITPDGPRGPRMRASEGVASVARISGAPVIPVGVGVSNRKVLSSWDRFIIAKPFSKAAIVWGKPIEVSRKASDKEMEAARLQIEQSLIDVSVEADQYCGQEIIEPAPPITPDGESP